jgi:hypothetical protein
MLPKPGDGPSAEMRAKVRFEQTALIVFISSLSVTHTYSVPLFFSFLSPLSFFPSPCASHPSNTDLFSPWQSSFEFTVVAHGSAGATATCIVSGGDPGYDETAKMVSEAALVLARRTQAPAGRAGVVTPAFALADSLVPRLRERGIQFNVSVTKGPASS